jgi:hypothetical protein
MSLECLSVDYTFLRGCAKNPVKEAGQRLLDSARG